jgi:hypothetical protein
LRVAVDSATTVGASAALDIADAVGTETTVETRVAGAELAGTEVTGTGATVVGFTEVTGTGSAEATIVFETPSDEVEEFAKVLATEVTKVRKVLLVGGDVRAVYDGLVSGPVTVGYMVITELSTPGRVEVGSEQCELVPI